MKPEEAGEYSFYPSDKEKILKELGKERLLGVMDQMLKLRVLEVRAESAYQQGKIGGFFHAYIGQESVQTAAVEAMGKENWWITTYRCHALAYLLGATPYEIYAELLGKADGNAKGRGGSMHLYTDRLLGGFGIVGGQVPIATGAAFTLKYQGNRDEIAVCFLGDGAVPQGAFHEAVNLAALWDLPCMFVIENNQWGMGTHFLRANSTFELAVPKATAYGIEGYTLDGMDFFNCYQGFKDLFKKIKETQRPLIVEVITERFRGHSISDPGLYRSKDALKEVMQKDPLLRMKHDLVEVGILDEETYKEKEKAFRKEMVAVLQQADQSADPDPETLEKDVFAP